MKKKNTALVLLFLLPLIGFFTYASVLFIIMDDIASYNYLIGPPDTDNFYNKDEIDPDLMAEIADVLCDRFLTYHLPLNLSLTITFTDYNYDTVNDIHETDNAALYGGETMIGQCYRYATAKKEENKAEMDHALQIIKRLISGYSMLLAIPNGGIGPEYPGIPARFYSPPGKYYEKEYPEIFSDHYKMFNGTGKYHNYRCRLHTSLDEMGGYAGAFGSVLKFVDPDDSDDAKWCYNRVSLLTAQLIEGFKKTNWLVLHGDGTPAGSDLNMDFGGGAWKLAFLKLGAIAYPDRYKREYAYTYSKMLHSSQAGEGSAWNTINEYYAFAFSQCLVIALIINEDNEDIRDHYIKLYTTGFYNFLKYHRNAFVNSAFLGFMSLLDKDKRKQYENPDYDFNDVEWDLNDQLYRFKDWANPKGMSLTKEQWGIRNYNLTQRPHSTRSTSLNQEMREKARNPKVKYWRDWIDNTLFGSLYSWVRDDLLELEDIYLVPRTVSEASAGALIWGSNPFYGEGGDPYGNGLREERGNSFLVPYYIGRYYGVVEGPSN
ncbi:MAG: hypothetical protein ACTSR8_04860 [Promethearchaeota archaeon]